MDRRILIIRNVLGVWRRLGRVIGGIGGGRVFRRRWEVGREDGMGWDEFGVLFGLLIYLRYLPTLMYGDAQ